MGLFCCALRLHGGRESQGLLPCSIPILAVSTLIHKHLCPPLHLHLCYIFIKWNQHSIIGFYFVTLTFGFNHQDMPRFLSQRENGVEVHPKWLNVWEFSHSTAYVDALHLQVRGFTLYNNNSHQRQTLNSDHNVFFECSHYTVGWDGSYKSQCLRDMSLYIIWDMNIGRIYQVCVIV